jgi:phosphonate transport system substrate-binding protein
MEVGPFSYLLAVEEAGAEAVAVGCVTLASPAVYDPNLQPHYFSCLFTKKGNGIESLEDLRGRDFAFVDPASTSGHLAPKTLLLKSGLDPDKEMNTVFAGSHPSSLLAVWNGSMEAGATFGRNIFTQAQEGAVEYCGYALDELHVDLTSEDFQKRNQNCPEGSIIILAISDPIPETPFAVRQDLPMSLKQAIQDALLRVKDNPELVAQIRRWYVDPTQKRDIERIDHHYNSLREIAALLDLDLNALGE